MNMVGRDFDILGEGYGFGEGPVWREKTQDLLFCSISTGRVMRWSAAEGVTTFATLPSGGPNALAEGPDGRIYLAQCGGGHSPAQIDFRAPGGVQAVDDAGAVEWITLALIEPNDLCFGPDGWLYVTDPTRPSTRRDARLWRCNIETGEAELLFSVDYFANGIAFDAAGDLFVANSSDGAVIRYPFDDGRLGQPEVAIRMDHNIPDGMAFDLNGNLIIATVSRGEQPGDVQVWAPDGALVECFRVGESKKVTNLVLSEDRTLYVTTGDGKQELIRVPNWPTGPLPLFPFRTA
jgi:gluconolactonase